MAIEQLISLLAQSGAVGGFAALGVICYLWSQRVQDLTIAIVKRDAANDQRMGDLAHAISELTLVLMAQSTDPVQKEKLAAGLREMEHARREITSDTK